MVFKRINPPDAIKDFIECYWIIDDKNTAPGIQKIIPDGFPEIIFHYGDPYRISITGNWELQTDFLLAGQITKYFYLENTGRTGVFGIKLKPATVSYLFDLSMADYIDKVISLNNNDNGDFIKIKEILSGRYDHEQTVLLLNIFFENLIAEKKPKSTSIDNAVKLIFKRNGMVTIADLCSVTYLSERQLLNQFKKHVGLSPKLYSRIIRLNYIFRLVSRNKEKWSSLAYEAAFFDQAHFIKDFKKFAGENPGKYLFKEENMANFFLMPDSLKNYQKPFL